MSEKEDAGVIHGYEAIGEYLGLSARQAKHFAGKGDIPTFKLGAKVCARRASLDSWLADLEAKASAPHTDGGGK
ncbi:DNA-binding protein [Ancylobacter sp. IITR112]|uniref:DNA-binding protein n=1 Tax=Ancylobacter sp. IITR112 TaxID=3138073 RepID=UPI00352B2699